MPDVTQPLGTNGQPAQFAPLTDTTTWQFVSFTTSTQSAAIASSSAIITSTADCWFTYGANPTATVGAGSDFLPAGVKWGVTFPASGLKIAVIQNASGGNLSIVPTKSS